MPMLRKIKIPPNTIVYLRNPYEALPKGTYYWIDKNVLHLNNQYETDDYKAFTPGGNIPWISNTNITKVIIDNELTLNNCSNLFNGLSELTEIVNLELLDTSGCYNFSTMFNKCSKLQQIDFTKLDLSQASTLTSMCADCSRLTDVGEMITLGRENIQWSYAFRNCYALYSIRFNFENYVASFNTSQNVFQQCISLEHIYSNVPTWTATLSRDMFKNCALLPNYDSRSTDISKATWVDYGGYLEEFPE